MKFLTLPLAAAIGFAALATHPAHAIVNGTATTSFAAVGELGALSGVLIANNWVLTAAHVVAGITDPSGLSFVTASGSAFADAVFMHPSVDGFPENDLALVHLSTTVTTTLPVLYDTVLPNGAVRASTGISTVTMVSPRNQAPSGTALGTANRVMSSYTDTNTAITYTTNWLVATGSAYVENGDSGSALFRGAVNDTAGATLLGIASAQLTESNGSRSSAYVQVASYKNWINNTMAASGQQALWASAVPEPGTFWLFGAALAGMLLTSASVRQRMGQHLRYRRVFGFSSQHTDGDSMVPRSHERDQKSHHRAPQAH